MRFLLLNISVLVLLFCLAGWPSLPDINSVSKMKDMKAKDIKSGLINSSGIVTSSQVDAVIKAADKIDDAMRGLSAEQQYYLGRGVSALILQKYPLYTANPELREYVQLIGNALVIRSSRPENYGGYHFGILDTDEINAISAPGGFIFISRGFLKVVPNEEALAAVLAHEIGHVILGHGVNAISNAKITEATSLLGKEAINAFGPSELSALTNTFGDSVNEIYETLMNRGYSRSQEYEADRFAAALLVKAGYVAKGLPAMLDTLSKVGNQSKGGWRDTHPAPGERKSSLKLPKQKETAANGESLRSARFIAVAQNIN